MNAVIESAYWILISFSWASCSLRTSFSNSLSSSKKNMKWQYLHSFFFFHLVFLSQIKTCWAWHSGMSDTWCSGNLYKIDWNMLTATLLSIFLIFGNQHWDFILHCIHVCYNVLRVTACLQGWLWPTLRQTTCWMWATTQRLAPNVTWHLKCWMRLFRQTALMPIRGWTYGPLGWCCGRSQDAHTATVSLVHLVHM